MREEKADFIKLSPPLFSSGMNYKKIGKLRFSSQFIYLRVVNRSDSQRFLVYRN
jgi:hypothetical protein